MSRLRRRGFLGAFGAALLAGCAAGADPSADDGPSGAASGSTSGTEPSAGETRETPRDEVTRATTGDVESRWDTFVPGQYTLSAPAVAADALYIGGAREVRRLSLADGTVEWAAPLDALTHAFTPALRGDAVYAAARDMVGGTLLDSNTGGVVAALSATDGTERWRTGAPVTADPTLADGAVLVPTTADGDGTLLALDADDGTERWPATLGRGDAVAAATVADDLAVVPLAREDGGQVVAVSTADGAERWAVDAGPVEAAAAVADGTVYVVTTDGTVLALDAGDGDERWRRPLDGGSYTRPVVAGDAVYVATGDTVHALARGDGTERWRATVANVARTGVTVAGGRVYVGGNEVTALDADDGELAWSQQLVGVAGTFGAPAFRDGVLYTGACVKREGNDPYDHYVFALAEPDG